MVEHHREHDSEQAGHEPLSVSARSIVVSMAVLFATVVGALLLMWGLSQWLSATENGKPTVAAPGTPIALPQGVPNVDADQTSVLRELQALEERLLHQYAWVDRSEGIARIPITRAMEIIAQQPAPAAVMPQQEKSPTDENSAEE